MAEDRLKITRNVRGGILRLARIVVGVVIIAAVAIKLPALIAPLLYYYIPGKDAPGRGVHFDQHLRPSDVLTRFVALVCLLWVALYLLQGTLARVGGALLSLSMAVVLLVGYALKPLGVPERALWTPMALLLIGLTVVYTGHAEWSLIPFVAHQKRIGFDPTAQAAA